MKLFLIVVILIAGTAAFFFYRATVTGTVIEWKTQELPDGESFFSTSSGSGLAPPPTLTERGANGELSPCEQALKVRAEACDVYVSDFPDGCQWWQFSLISSCPDKRAVCFEKHNAAVDACK